MVSESIEPDDIDPAWTKQRRWQEQVDTQMEDHFKLNAPERLRALIRRGSQSLDLRCAIHSHPISFSLALSIQAYQMGRNGDMWRQPLLVCK